jgi:hypothetical protein
VREGLRRQRAFRGRTRRALVGDRLDRPRRRGELFEFTDLQEQLRAVEGFALARSEEPPLQPRDLRTQRRVLLAELPHFSGDRDRGGGHFTRRENTASL